MCRKHCQSGLAPSSANRREPLCKKLYGVQGNPQPYRKTSRGQHVTWYDSIWFLSFKSLLFHSSYYDCSVHVLTFHVTSPYVLILHVMIPHVIPSLWTEFSCVDLEYVLVGPYYPKKIAFSVCSNANSVWRVSQAASKGRQSSLQGIAGLTCPSQNCSCVPSGWKKGFIGPSCLPAIKNIYWQAGFK